MLPIYLCGEKIGFAEWTSYGIKASCSMEEGFIYRLELVGKSTLPLGVMMPQGNRFFLERRGVSPSEGWDYAEILRCKSGDKKADPLPFAISHGRIVNDFEFVKDDFLRTCLLKQASVYSAIYRGRRYVYFTFDPNCHSSMSAFFFCLTVFDTPEGLFAAFCIDENNIPVAII